MSLIGKIPLDAVVGHAKKKTQVWEKDFFPLVDHIQVQDIWRS